MKKLFQIGPIARISLGIMCLIISLVLVFDFFHDLLPTKQMLQTETRSFGSHVIVDQVGILLANGDQRVLQNMLDRLTSDGSEILSIGVRRADDTLVAASRDHALRWTSTSTGASTPAHVVVSLLDGNARWGNVELLFVDQSAHTAIEWLLQPNAVFFILLSTIGFVVVYFYLRRALHYLDPGHAVPQRVRRAFDTLTEAVLIINVKGQVMMANTAFQKMASGSLEQIEGKPIAQMDWLVGGLAKENDTNVYPWHTVLHSNQTAQGKNLTVTLPDGSRHELIMNCSAISDGSGIARGCLITLDDVTPLREANARLQTTLADLEFSRDQIQQQNEELQKHAHHDHLTGCLNRRAFFAQADPIFKNAVATGGHLFCIMADIDHFKFFNDQFGHAVGDTVIQSVAATLRRSLCNGDLLCRYGGEEFCILFSNADEKKGIDLAERIRARIRAECSAGVSSAAGLQITVSIGIAPMLAGKGYSSLPRLIEKADQALYVAKNAGRNRVAYADGTILSGEDPPSRKISVPAPVGAVLHAAPALE